MISNSVEKLVTAIAEDCYSASPTRKEREFYLNKLNRANSELYWRLRNCNQFFASKKLYKNNKGYFEKTDDIYYLKAIYNNKKRLDPITLRDDIFYIKEDKYYQEGNKIYVNIDNLPKEKQSNVTELEYINVVYLPILTPLVEEVEEDEDGNVNGTDKTIYLPSSLYLLVEVAVYHSIIRNRGYMSQALVAYERYKEALVDFTRIYNTSS